MIGFWVTQKRFWESQRRMRDFIRKSLTEMEARIMAGQQDAVNEVTAAINSGVEELYAEIQRVSAENPGVDLSGLQAIAERLKGDNIPAAPPVDPAPPVEEGQV